MRVAGNISSSDLVMYFCNDIRPYSIFKAPVRCCIDVMLTHVALSSLGEQCLVLTLKQIVKYQWEKSYLSVLLFTPET